MKVRLIIVFFSLFFSISIMGAELEHRYSSLTHKKAKIGREFRRVPLNYSNSSGWSLIDWELLIEYADFFSEYEEVPIASLVYGYPNPLNSWDKLDQMSEILLVDYHDIQSISEDTIVGKISNKTITTLNSTGNPVENITSLWDTVNGIWLKRYRDTFSYDDKENLTEICDFEWNVLDSSWENDDWKTNYYYDSDGNVVAVVEYLLDSITGNFEPEDVCSCYYDINGNPSYILDNIGDPFYFSKHSFTYNVDGKLSEMIDYRWNVDSSKWKEDFTYAYSYDTQGRLVEEIRNTIINNTIEDRDKDVWIYDANGLLIEELDYNWDADSGAWVCYRKSVLTYNGEGSIVEYACYKWDFDSNDWVLDKDNGEYVFHYTSKGHPLVLSLLQYDINTGELSSVDGYAVYCEYSNAINPWHHFSKKSLSPSVTIQKTSHTLVITVDAVARKDDVMKVYDLLGKEIVTLYPQKNNGKVLYQWNYRNCKGSPFANQVYMISIKTGEANSVLKQILRR